MSEKTQRFRDFCSAFSVEFLKLTDSFLIWVLPVILFLLVFIGNILWGLTGVILSVLIPIIITMSYLYFNLWKTNKKSPQESTSSPTPKFTVSYEGQGQGQSPNHNIQFGNINQRNSRPSVSIRTTTMYQDRYSPRGSMSGSLNESESVLLPPGDTTGFDESQNREDDLECDDSSTIAEGLGNFRNQQRKTLSPSEWSQVTSPGFSSRVVRQAALHSPLSEYNFKGMNKNQSPFDMSPNGPLKLGEIPFGSRWRHSGRNSGQVREYKLAVSRKREPKENGTVYLKIAPMEGMGFVRNDNPDLDQSNSNETPKMSSGLGGISQAGLNNSRYTRLSPSANSTLERSLRMRNTSPSTSSTFNIVEVLSNRKGKRNRGHDSPLEPSTSPRSPSSAISNLSISTDDNPKDSKRVKFIMPPEPNTSRNLSMLPLTSHNNPENGNMTSESILEQMNQTEKRFLPDDDTPPSIRPLPKKGRPSDRGLHGTSGASSSATPNSSSSYRKRRASSSVFSMVEEEARGKAPRFCNCTECYEEAAGVSTYVPQQKKVDVPLPPMRRVVKAITCDRSTETELFTGGGTRRVSRNLPLPISKERYDQDKKLHAQRLQKILDISLQQFIPASSSGPQQTFTTTNSTFTSTPSTFTSSFPAASTHANIISNNQSIVSQSQASPPADSADSRFSSAQLPTTTGSIAFTNGSTNNTSSASSVNTSQSFSTGGNVGQNAGFQTPEKSSATPTFSGFGGVASTTTVATPILQTTTPVISFGTDLQSVANSEGNKSAVSDPQSFSGAGATTGLFTFGTGSTSTTQANVTGSSSSTSGQSSTVPASGTQSLPLNSSIFGKTSNEFNTTTSSPGISTSSTSGKDSDTASVGSTVSTASSTSTASFTLGQSQSLFKSGTQSGGMSGGQQQSIPTFGSPSVLGGTQEQNSASRGFGSSQQPEQTTTASTPAGFGGFKQPSANATNTTTSGGGGFPFGGTQPSQQQSTPAASFSFGSPNNAATNPQNNSGGLFAFGQPAQPKQDSIPPGTSSLNGAQQTSTAGNSVFPSAPSTFTSPFSSSQANVTSSSQPRLSSAQLPTTAGSTSFSSGSANNVLPTSSLNTTQSFGSGVGGTGQDAGFQAFGKSLTTPSFSGFGAVAPTTTAATPLSQTTTPSTQISFGSNLQSGVSTGATTGTGLFTFGAGSTQQSSMSGNSSSNSGQPSTTQAPGNQFPLNSSIFGKTSSDLTSPSAGLSAFGTSGPRNETPPLGSTTSSTSTGFAFGQAGQSNLFKSPGTQPTGGIFGGQQQNVPTFGSPTVFGGAPQPNTSSFGSTGFGSPQQATASSTPSGFGGFNQPSSTNTAGAVGFGFGAQPSQQQAAPSSGFGSTGIFGTPLNQQRTAPTGGFGAPLSQTSPTGGFGTSLTGLPQTSPNSGFGAPLSQTSQTGGFGAPLTSTTGGFGAPLTSTTGGFGTSLTQQQTSPSSAFGTPLTQQQPAQTSGFSFGNPNNAATNLQNNPGLFAFGQTAQPNQGFTFGQGNAAAPAMPAPGANPMFTLGANTTPRRRDARARRYR